MSYLCKKVTKPKSSAWNYFKQVHDQDGKFTNSSGVKYQCIYCNARYAAHATRLTAHLSRGCRKCPQSVAAEFTNLLRAEKHARNKSRIEHVSEVITEDKCELLDDVLDIDKLSTIFSVEKNYPPRASDVLSSPSNSQYQFIAESLYARAYFSERISLNVTESEYWREFLNFLNPQFTVPSRLQLVQQLLKREYSYVEGQVRDVIENSNVLCLQCLVSSDQSSCFVANFIINVPKPLFHKSVIVSSRQEIAHHIEHEVTSLLNDSGQHKVIAILSNDPSLLAILNEETFRLTNTVKYNCAINSLNLLLNDILGVETASSLRLNSLGVIEELQLKLPELSVILKSSRKDDWKSISACFESILENEDMLKILASSEVTNISKHVQKVILDSQYWNRLKKLNVFVRPVFEWLNVLSSSDVRISVLVDCFHDIEVHIKSTAENIFSKSEVKKIRQSFLHCKSLTISPIHLSANILDPRSNGCHLSDNEQVLGSEFIDRVGSIMYKNNHEAVKEVLCELAKYRCHEGIFSASYVRKTANDLSPEIWWKGSCYGLKLSEVADFILSIPASTTSIESSLKSDMAHLKNHDLNAEELNQYLFTHKNLKLMQHPPFDSIETKSENESEETENLHEKLMFEEDISEIEYEVTLDDSDDN